MPSSKARKATININAAREAERREVPKKKLEAFMKKKVEIDTKLNDTLDDLLADFRKDISVFIGGHIKFDPKNLNDLLSEHTAKMKEILAATTMLFASLSDSAYKVVVHSALIKGLDLVKGIAVEMNDLRDEMDDAKKQ